MPFFVGTSWLYISYSEVESDVSEVKMEHELEDLPPTTGKEALCFISQQHFFLPLCLRFSLESVVQCLFFFPAQAVSEALGPWCVIQRSSGSVWQKASRTKPPHRIATSTVSLAKTSCLRSATWLSTRSDTRDTTISLHYTSIQRLLCVLCFLIGCRFVNMKAIIHRLGFVLVCVTSHERQGDFDEIPAHKQLNETSQMWQWWHLNMQIEYC